MPLSRSLRCTLAHDRWLGKPGPLAAAMRFATSVPGQILINTAAFRLPEELGMGPRTRLLDVACRRASLLRVLATRARLERLPAGLDASPRLLAAARRDIEIEGGPQVILTQGVAQALPFAGETFDLVVSAHAFRYLTDEELRGCMEEARRVLREGGLFLAWEFAPTRSELLDRWNRWLLGREAPIARLRNYRELRAIAHRCAFDWVRRAELRPFLFPPMPRVSIVMGKAPRAWKGRAAANETMSERPPNAG
jgi:SAM-dependent methyltransferase